jgi:transcriptional regulator with XRE-family HTH domain
VINVKNKKLLKAIGLRIRELRKQKKLSQEELSYKSELMLSQIGRIERGETNPTISTLYVLAEALEVELKDLVDVNI